MCELLNDGSHSLDRLICSPTVRGNHDVSGFGGNKPFREIVLLIRRAAIDAQNWHPSIELHAATARQVKMRGLIARKRCQGGCGHG
jgi:hypothetical protein